MEDSRLKKDSYMQALKDQMSGVSPQNSVEGVGGGESEPDYYDLLKNESYKTMLKSEVQAYNAQEQARKYATTGLGANGYGSQGLSESASLGIGNTYQRALRDAQEQYDNDVLQINKQQREAVNADFESLATMMGSTSSSDQLNRVLLDYGYMDENGQWTKEFSKLDSATQRQLKSLYSLYSSEFSNQEWLSNNTINGVGYKDSGTAIQNVAAADGSLGSVSNELKMIFGDDYIKQVETAIENNGGDYCVKLVNKSSDKKYVYMIYRNGVWYQTTANVYNKAENKDVIKGAK